MNSKKTCFLGLILSCFLVAGCKDVEPTEEGFSNPITVQDDVDSSPVTGEEDGFAIIEEEGWSTPVKLPVDDDGAEDGTYITRDGRYVMYYHVPNWEGESGVDPQIYFTERPFLTREVHPITSSDFNAETGPYISEAGDIYYTKTFIVLEPPPPHEATPRKTVVNDGTTIIDMGTGLGEGNPHYCDATDELYANVLYETEDQDQDIAV